jgi:hypothetical protein
MLWPLYTQAKTPSTHWIEAGYPRVDLNVVAKKNFCPCQKSNLRPSSLYSPIQKVNMLVWVLIMEISHLNKVSKRDS